MKFWALMLFTLDVFFVMVFLFSAALVLSYLLRGCGMRDYLIIVHFLAGLCLLTFSIFSALIPEVGILPVGSLCLLALAMLSFLTSYELTRD